DGVQLHGAHGYLLSRSISPRHNRRKDAFGGDFEGRLALLEAVYARVRAAVGDDFPVIIKLNAHDGRPGKGSEGLKVEEAIEIGRRLEAWGIDAIEVSAGTGDEGLGFYPNRGDIPVDLSKRFLAREMPFLKGVLPALGPILRQAAKKVALEEEAYFLPIARRFAQALKVPIIAVGGFRSLALAERALQEGVAMVALARPLVAQPDLPRRWREGRVQQASCTSCNRCFLQVGLGEPLRCTGLGSR
ncbi:MAG: NADH:flavin oxidoreductase, partial [Deltaproteobacteria bacterium]|nr:NADH:flavin oxidoreductase [Deltaproteobacteria bacterium]